MNPIGIDRATRTLCFAIEAMHETGGILTVKSLLSEDGQVLISITDTGPGLSADHTEKIFDAFFTTKPQGSGMGLAISRSIVESHGGRHLDLCRKRQRRDV